FHRAAPIAALPATALHIVHWNAQNPLAKPEAVIAALRKFDADVLFLTDINWMTWVQLQNDPLNIGVPAAHQAPFTIVSRVPIVSIRPLVATRELIFVVLVELDTTERLGRPLKVYLVDMPSNPRLSRAEMMRTTR